MAELAIAVSKSGSTPPTWECRRAGRVYGLTKPLGQFGGEYYRPFGQVVSSEEVRCPGLLSLPDEGSNLGSQLLLFPIQTSSADAGKCPLRPRDALADRTLQILLLGRA